MMKILMRGGGDLASAVALKLFNSGFKILICELENPLVIRRTVSFAGLITDLKSEVEGVKAKRLRDIQDIKKIEHDAVYVTTIDEKIVMEKFEPDVFIDATLSKKEVDYNINYAPIVIGLGPEIEAEVNADFVIETNRGHNLGKILTIGKAQPNTKIPGMISGESKNRVHYSGGAGVVQVICDIGTIVKKGDIIAKVDKVDIKSNLNGVVRGMIKNESVLTRNTKIADVDPRGDISYCYSVTDKGRTIAGAVLEAIMMIFNKDGIL